MTDAQLAFRVGEVFDRKITSVFWTSFKGEYGKIQAEVLVYLHGHASCQASEIARALNVPKQHISKIVGNLEMQNMVAAEPIATDRRKKGLSLTPEGQQYLEAHIRESNEHFNGLLSRLDDRRRDQLRTAMQTMNSILQAL